MKYIFFLAFILLNTRSIYAPPAEDLLKKPAEESLDQQAKKQLLDRKADLEKSFEQLKHERDDAVFKKLSPKTIADAEIRLAKTNLELQRVISRLYPERGAEAEFNAEKQLGQACAKFSESVIKSAEDSFLPSDSGIQVPTFAREFRMYASGPRLDQVNRKALLLLDIAFDVPLKLLTQAERDNLQKQAQQIKKTLESSTRYRTITSKELQKALKNRDDAQLRLLNLATDTVVKNKSRSLDTISDESWNLIKKALADVTNASNQLELMLSKHEFESFKMDASIRFGLTFELFKNRLLQTGTERFINSALLEPLITELVRDDGSEKTAAKIDRLVKSISMELDNGTPDSEISFSNPEKNASLLVKQLFRLIEEAVRREVASETLDVQFSRVPLWKFIQKLSLVLGIVSSTLTIIKFLLEGDVEILVDVLEKEAHKIDDSSEALF